jgi:hypothetical protein
MIDRYYRIDDNRFANNANERRDVFCFFPSLSAGIITFINDSQ